MTRQLDRTELDHVECTHQGLDNRLVDEVSESRAGPVQRHERLGRLLSSYYRAAA